MRRITVRELRQSASVWLRQVQSGQSFEVTSRGRPVALLAPLPRGSELERLIASGRVRQAAGDVLGHGPPLPPHPSVPLPSRVLEQMRDDER